MTQGDYPFVHPRLDGIRTRPPVETCTTRTKTHTRHKSHPGPGLLSFPSVPRGSRDLLCGPIRHSLDHCREFRRVLRHHLGDVSLPGG